MGDSRSTNEQKNKTFVDKQMLPSKTPIQSNLKKQDDLMETDCLITTIKMVKNSPVVQLYGGRGMGKESISNCVLSGLTKLPGEFSAAFNMSSFLNKGDVIKGFKAASRQLAEKNFLQLRDVEDENVGTHLIREIKRVGIKVAFSMKLLPGFEESVDGLIHFRKIMDEARNAENHVKLLIATTNKNVLFTKDEVDNVDGYSQVEISGFNHNDEGAKYLTVYKKYEIQTEPESPGETEPKSLQEKPDLLPEEFETATELSKYFDYNPACLKGVKVYCSSKMGRKSLVNQYKEYLILMGNDKTRHEVHKDTVELLKKYHHSNAEAYQALHLLDNNTNGPRPQHLDSVLGVWKVFHNEYLPVVLLYQILYYLGLNENDQSQAQIKKRAHDLIVVLNNRFNVTSLSALGDTISIPKNIHDTLPNKEKEKNLTVAIKAITSLMDKDNRLTGADLLLFQVNDHLHCLCNKIRIFLKDQEFDMKSADKDKFEMFLKICRVYELSGQAKVQGKDKSKWPEALGVLFKSAEIVWQGVCSFEKRGIFFPCFSAKTSTDALEYNDSSNPEKKAKEIVDHCIRAGKQLFKKGSKYVEEYLVHTLKVNLSNMDDFIFNCTQGDNGLSQDMAKQTLKEVKEAIESAGNNPLPLEPQLIQILRKTNNLLSTEKYCEVFLAERLASIFHIYGRQVLYLQNRMEQNDQRKCEYYAQLAHEISLEIRKKTGIGLLYEYITTANSMVPRKLQDRKGESKSQRQERLEKAYELCKKLLTDPGPMYEEGKYKRIMGTPYTTLNAYKCIVKANCKQLKDHANPLNPSKSAKIECTEMFGIARENISINMAPNCCIQAMKFFAATGNFDDAFEAFDVGFKHETGGKTYGISQLNQRNPNTYIWAIYNYLLAVKACKKGGTYNGKMADLEKKARQLHDAVVKMEAPEELKKRLIDLNPDKFED